MSMSPSVGTVRVRSVKNVWDGSEPVLGGFVAAESHRVTTVAGAWGSISSQGGSRADTLRGLWSLAPFGVARL
jgi:hypothetical protein